MNKLLINELKKFLNHSSTAHLMIIMTIILSLCRVVPSGTAH